MIESGERKIIERNNDELYVDITFLIKYKIKNQLYKNKKQTNINNTSILEGYTTVENVVLKYYRNIGKILSDFIREQPTYMSRVNYYYLKRKGEIIKEIDKNLKVCQTGIKNRDEIIIIDDMELKKKLDEQIRLNELNENKLTIKINKKKLNDDFNQILKIFLKKRVDKSQIKLIKDTIENEKKKRNIRYIMLGVFLFLVLALIGVGVYFYFKIKGNENDNSYINEELVIDIKYIPNMIYRYNFKKKIQMKAEGESISEENSTKEIDQGSDFFLIIREEHSEKNNKTSISKRWYTGYLAIVNLSFLNETGATEMIYDKYLYNTLNQRNLKNDVNKKDKEKRNLDTSIGNITFVKIEFYENGGIKNIYYPKDIFSLPNMMYVKEYFNLIIPKISPDLYTDSINDTLNNYLLNNSQENDEEFSDSNDTFNNFDDYFENNDTFYDDNETNETNDDIDDFRHLEEKKNKLNKPTKRKKIYRLLSNNSSSQEYQIEEYLTSSLIEENINYNLREKNNCSNCSNPNLTQFSTESIKSDAVDLENSIINKTIYTNINKDGILESVIEIEKSIMKTVQDENEEDLRDIQFKEDTFNDDNQLSMDDVKDDYKYNITFGLDSLSFETINQVNLRENFINHKISKILFRYFDTFSYELFDENYYNNYLYSLVEEKIKNETNFNNTVISSSEEEIDNLRRMGNLDNTYYGMKKIINEKDLYNYNLLGLKMQKQIFNEIDPSTGIITSYFIMIFGNVNKKIKTSEQRSNLHIILEKKNQMIFNLMQLLDKSNSDLKK